MLRPWRCSLRVTQQYMKLLLSCPEGDLLKAQLDPRPCHPRALLTLLEGLSLWAGEPLSVALSADEREELECLVDCSETMSLIRAMALKRLRDLPE